MSAEWFPDAQLRRWGYPIYTHQLGVLHRTVYRTRYVSCLTPLIAERAASSFSPAVGSVRVIKKIKTSDGYEWFFGVLINRSYMCEEKVPIQKAMVLFPYPYDFQRCDNVLSDRHLALYISDGHYDLWMWEMELLKFGGYLILQLEAAKGTISLLEGGDYGTDWTIE